MAIVYLDTHVLVLLYQGDVARLSAPARRAIDRSDPLVSPAAVLELQYLHEIGRLRTSASALTQALVRDLGLRVCDLPFPAVVEQAWQESWSRDPFDRLIVAQAKARPASLITKDQSIHDHYRRAIW